MFYESVFQSMKRIKGITVTHKEELVTFDGVQIVSGGNTDKNLFTFMNEFFESRPANELDKLFDLIKQAKLIIDPGYFGDSNEAELEELRKNNLDYKYLISKLTPIFEKMYELIPPNDITYAAEAYGKTKAPRDLEAMTSMGDYPEATTIDKYKYVELVKLAFVGQLILPIMGEFLNHVVPITGKDYREAVGGIIINKLTAITSLPGWKILREYIEARCNMSETKRNPTLLISDIKYIDFIVYRGFFNKLCLAFIPSETSKNIANDLNSLVEGEGRLGSETRIKGYSDPKPGGDDISLAEGYLINQDINASDLLGLNEFFSFGLYDEEENPCYEDVFKYQAIALGIKNDYKAQKLYFNLPTNWRFIFTDVHLKILQLTYFEDHPVLAYPAMSYEQLMAAICLAQVKLYEKGYRYLPLLLSSVINETRPRPHIDESMKLTTKERELLDSLCDDYIGQSESINDNSLVVSVMSFLDDVYASVWDSTITIDILENDKFLDTMNPGEMFEVDPSPEIKREIYKLFLASNDIEV